MKKLFLAAAVMPFLMGAAVAADKVEAHHPHWSYTGKAGVSHWGDLEEAFETCKLGKEQSPINIRGAKKGDLPAIGFDYKASAAEVVNNGHTIQVNLADSGDVKLAAGEFKLVQFHFHSPSEEKVGGKAFPLNAHLVHRNAEGKLAVVSVFFKLSKQDNPVLAKVFSVMPKEEGEKAALAEAFNPADLLPESRDYYSYVGSLTTPPCSEGVQWQVMKTPVAISKAQLAAFKKLYPMNARPVQPLNGRSIQSL